MFRFNDTQQGSLFDRCANMTARERGILENSWAGDFSREIFPLVNEERFAPLYSSVTGRPNTPVNILVSTAIIKELFGYTDEELVEHVLLDLQVIYALRLTSAPEIPFSDRSLSRFREALLKYENETGIDLLKQEIVSLALHAKETLGINEQLLRMDSMMISSRCKTIGRLELVYTCVENLVEKFVNIDGIELLPEGLVKYTKAGNKNATIYRAKGDEPKQRLESAIADALAILELCGDRYNDCPEHALMSRMLSDQTDGGKAKAGKDVKADSLQNPSDPDATFRRKAGKRHTGYTANFVEDCGEGGNVIIDYDLQQNNYSDAQFAKDVIANSKEGDVIIGDGAFGSEENIDAAEARGATLVTTCLTGKEPNLTIVDFKFEGDQIARCPQGHTPAVATYSPVTGKNSATFEGHNCSGCPLKGSCPAKEQKSGFFKVEFTDVAYNRSLHARNLDTDEYKEYSKKRNGVEGIPSVMRRRYGVNLLPVFGTKRSKLLLGLKVAASNAISLFKGLRNKHRTTGAVCLSQ